MCECWNDDIRVNYLDYIRDERNRMAKENIGLWNKLFPEFKVKEEI